MHREGTKSHSKWNEIAAAFDLGSNTVRGLLARPRGDGKAQVIAEAQRMTALGRGLTETGLLDPRGIAATVDFIGATLSEWGEPKHVFAVATAAVREAVNAAELVEALGHVGVCLEVISGEEEGRLSYLGALATNPELAGHKPVVVDIGGRSTEVVRCDDGGLEAISCAVGARSICESIMVSDPPAAEEIVAAQDSVWEVMRETGAEEMLKTSAAVVAVGGTAQSAMLLCGTEQVSHGEVVTLLHRLCGVPLRRRREMMPFDPERASIICGGLVILEVVATQAASGSLHISTGGVREGLLLERMGVGRLVW